MNYKLMWEMVSKNQAGPEIQEIKAKIRDNRWQRQMACARSQVLCCDDRRDRNEK